MFFVGATGQLLTLILTVCLPFVFLLSGQQKINIPETCLRIEINNIQHEIVQQNLNAYSFTNINTNEDCPFEFIAENCIPRKIPLRNYNVNMETFYIDSSGNKAPPAFHCFC